MDVIAGYTIENTSRVRWKGEYIVELDDRHLVNIINKLRRHALMAQESLTPLHDEKNIGVEAFLYRHCISWPRLREEAMKRQLWRSYPIALSAEKITEGGDIHQFMANQWRVERNEAKRRMYSLNYGTAMGSSFYRPHPAQRRFFEQEEVNPMFVNKTVGDVSDRSAPFRRLDSAIEDLQRRVLLDRKDWEEAFRKRVHRVEFDEAVTKHNALADKVALLVDHIQNLILTVQQQEIEIKNLRRNRKISTTKTTKTARRKR